MNEPRRGFPATRHSIVRALHSNDESARRHAFEAVVAAYWRPVYSYLRWFKDASPPDAEDWTQGFFAFALERGVLDRFDPERARFRTWVRTCLDGYVANIRKASRRQKRGGDVRHVSLDFETAEGEVRERPIPSDVDVEAAFHREWIRELLSASVKELERSSVRDGRSLELAIFASADLEDRGGGPRLTYREIAERHGVSVTKVTNTLHTMRRRLRDTILARLREISATEEEFRSEASSLFGGERR